MSLTAEALVATVGIWPKKAPGVPELLAAQGLPKRWKDRISAWMEGTQKAADFPTPPKDQEKFQDKIITPPKADEMTAWLQQLGEPDVGMDFAALVMRSRDYLTKTWQGFQINTGDIVPEMQPLSGDDYAEVWCRAQVLNDPDVILDWLDSWTLLGSQPALAAFFEVYPELTAMLREFINEELTDHIVRKQPLREIQTDLIRMVRGLAPGARLEIPMTAQGEPRAAPAKEFAVDFKSLRTPGESATARASH